MLTLIEPCWGLVIFKENSRTWWCYYNQYFGSSECIGIFMLPDWIATHSLSPSLSNVCIYVKGDGQSPIYKTCNNKLAMACLGNDPFISIKEIHGMSIVLMIGNVLFNEGMWLLLFFFSLQEWRLRCLDEPIFWRCWINWRSLSNYIPNLGNIYWYHYFSNHVYEITTFWQPDMLQFQSLRCMSIGPLYCVLNLTTMWLQVLV